MTKKFATVDEYLNTLPDESRATIEKIRSQILNNLPAGFVEEISYGMIGYVVPHSIYPKGYHCTPELPLPFLNLALQKKFIAIYHVGMYVNPELQKWFQDEYPKHCKTKLDMGKSCIRFKKMNDIPYTLIGELASKMSVTEWINLYEKNVIAKQKS